MHQNGRAVLYKNNPCTLVPMNLALDLDNAAERKAISLIAHVSAAFA